MITLVGFDDGDSGRLRRGGADWLHEVKHDGWRAQLHRSSDVVIFSKNGKEISGRFRIRIPDALRSLPDCIIDAEMRGPRRSSLRRDPHADL